MGLLISRFRSKKSTIEVLEDIDKDINRLQKNRKQNQERQKKIVTSLLIYSIAAYILSAVIFFVCYFPETWKLRLLYSLPLLIFPLLIWGIKKLLHWYFVKRIASNDGELLKLREQKKQILEDVMETETYKKAKEILEKFDPVRFQKLETLPEASSPTGVGGTPGTALHQRSVGMRPAAPQQRQRQVAARTPMSTPRMPLPQPRPMPAPTPVKTSTPYPATPNRPPRFPGGQPASAGPYQQQQQQQQQAGSVQRPTAQQQQMQQQQQAMMGNTPMNARGFGMPMPPGPPMPRTVLPQNRGTMDRLMDYLVGDGPENRYALICQKCFSHNGMALKEEFEYLAFRCCYCYYLNPARKQRPMAPRLEFFAPRGRDLNTDSQGSAASGEDSDEDDSEDDGDGNGHAKPGMDTKTPARHGPPRPGVGRGRGGLARDGGDAGKPVKNPGSAASLNTSSNAKATVKAPGALTSAASQQQRQENAYPTAGSQGRQSDRALSGAGPTVTDVKRKEDANMKPEKSAIPHAPLAGDKTQSESRERTDDKSNVVQSELLDIKSPDIVAAAGHSDTSDTTASDGRPEPAVPFIDEGDDEVSSRLHDLQISGTQAKTGEDLSSFTAVPTEDQTDPFTDTDLRTSVSTVGTDHGSYVNSPHSGEGDSRGNGQLGEERGVTLSEEIRGSVKSLLSPTVSDGGSIEGEEDNIFLGVDSEQQQAQAAE